MAAKYAVASLSGGRTLWSDGSVTGGSTAPIPTPTPYLSPSQGGNPYIVPGTVGAPVAGNATPIASTKNSMTGGTNVQFDNGTQVPSSSVDLNSIVNTMKNPTPVPTPTQPVNNGGTDAATKAWNSAKQQANDYYTSGQNTFNTLMDSINKFRDRAQGLYNSADQAITNTAAENLGADARTGQELQGTSRAMGRALGLGDSSKMNAQNKILANLAGTQGSVMATKGENQTANTNNLQAQNDTADTNEQNANNYMQTVTNGRNQIEAGGQANYDSALQNIVNYNNQIAALQGNVNPSSLTQMNPNFSTVQNTLTPGLTLPTAPATTGTDASLAANPVTDPNILNKKITGYDQYTGLPIYS